MGFAEMRHRCKGNVPSPCMLCLMRDTNWFRSRKGCYTRTFGDEPRKFEPWSSDVDDTCEQAPPLLTTTPTGGRFSSRQI
ncbi:hypothetical protein TNCV_4383651 [Trichonephila clavipes]|nr:hypothetical protein TNCV_4383651 [Trichonephila clavipes]